MHFIELDDETDFDRWRKAARVLALHDIKPSDVSWHVRGNAHRTVRALADARTAHPAGSMCRRSSWNWPQTTILQS